MVIKEFKVGSAAEINAAASFFRVVSCLNVFDLRNAQRYFNIESILKKELKDDNIPVCLDTNIFLVLDIIFKKQNARVTQQRFQQDLPKSCVDCKRKSTTPSKGSTVLGTNQLKSPSSRMKRLRLDLSLTDSDTDGSITFLPAEKTPNKREQNISVSQAEVESEGKREIPNSSGKNPADLSSLFYLMSMLPEPSASYCKRVMDQDDFNWKISLYDIIIVFLNWGATLKSLDLEEILTRSEMFQPLLEPSEKNAIPKPSNVRLVLLALEKRLPPESQVPQSFWSVLIKILIFGTIDTHQKQNYIYFSTALRVVSNYISDWSDDRRNLIVNVLGLKKMDPLVSVRVCFRLFDANNEQLSLIGLMASHHVLNHVFGLVGEQSLTGLIKSLVETPDLLERYSLEHVYCIVEHVNSLLPRYAYTGLPCSEEEVIKIHEWSSDLRGTLNIYPYNYDFESSHVRERLARLSTECASIMRYVFNKNINKTFIENFSV